MKSKDKYEAHKWMMKSKNKHEGHKWWNQKIIWSTQINDEIKR